MNILSAFVTWDWASLRAGTPGSKLPGANVLQLGLAAGEQMGPTLGALRMRFMLPVCVMLLAVLGARC